MGRKISAGRKFGKRDRSCSGIDFRSGWKAHWRIRSTGIRNCVGLAVHPTSGELYCLTNERDGFGDDLVPDYITRVREGAFFAWPWFYIGDNEDPRHIGERADLKGTSYF